MLEIIYRKFDSCSEFLFIHNHSQLFSEAGMAKIRATFMGAFALGGLGSPAIAQEAEKTVPSAVSVDPCDGYTSRFNRFLCSYYILPEKRAEAPSVKNSAAEPKELPPIKATRNRAPLSVGGGVVLDDNVDPRDSGETSNPEVMAPPLPPPEQ